MIPKNIKVAIDRHVEHGAPVGSFTQAVLENDLAMAVGHADQWSYANLKEIVQYCWNEIPGEAWGSKEKVKAWREARHGAVNA